MEAAEKGKNAICAGVQAVVGKLEVSPRVAAARGADILEATLAEVSMAAICLAVQVVERVVLTEDTVVMVVEMGAVEMEVVDMVVEMAATAAMAAVTAVRAGTAVTVVRAAVRAARAAVTVATASHSSGSALGSSAARMLACLPRACSVSLSTRHLASAERRTPLWAPFARTNHAAQTAQWC